MLTLRGSSGHQSLQNLLGEPDDGQRETDGSVVPTELESDEAQNPVAGLIHMVVNKLVSCVVETGFGEVIEGVVVGLSSFSCTSCFSGFAAYSCLCVVSPSFLSFNNSFKRLIFALVEWKSSLEF